MASRANRERMEAEQAGAARLKECSFPQPRHRARKSRNRNRLIRHLNATRSPSVGRLEGSLYGRLG